MGLGILPPPGVAPTPAPLVQDFTSSGTWTKPDGAKYVRIECIGGGGSGYLASSSGACGGGIGGQYGTLMLDASLLTATVAVTVGAGGTHNIRGSSGGTGGTTSFGAYVSAPGGNGATTSIDPSGIQGATAGVGDGNTSPKGRDSRYGAGSGGWISGSNNPAAAGSGGTESAGYGLLKAGDGGTANAATQAAANGATPGGGGGSGNNTATYSGDGAPGAVRITTYF